MTAREHDPACDEWAGVMSRGAAFERDMQRFGFTSAHMNRVWIIPEPAEYGLVMPDRWEGDDS